MTQDEFGSIYQTGFDRTVRLLRCRGASFDQAEDISQSAWAQGWRKIDQLRDHRLLMGWINTIAINLHRRKGKHDARFEALSGFEACLEIGVDSTPLDIAKILQASRPADRRIFEQQLGGLSTAEIAENHGISTIAIRLRVFRARRNVRAALAGPPAARVAAAA